MEKKIKGSKAFGIIMNTLVAILSGATIVMFSDQALIRYCGFALAVCLVAYIVVDAERSKKC